MSDSISRQAPAAAVTLDGFLEAAWTEHAERPQEVADRLAASLGLVQSAADFRPFAALVTHVYGEHLGQWQQGVAVFEAMRKLPAYEGDEATEGPLARGCAALAYAGGDASALSSLSVDDSVAVLAVVASAFTGRGDFSKAIAAYSQALARAQDGLAQGSPAIRALAVGGNNLAAALEERSGRDAAETQAMVAAARAGLRYWKQAGTWLEEERAEYRLARSLLQAGEPAQAQDSARRCVQVCEANGAPPFELFFGHAVLAIAQRAAGDGGSFERSRRLAMDCFERLGADERKWCVQELAELGEPAT